MIYISHRGNLEGAKPDRENHPDYIDKAILAGFDVEIDVRVIGGEMWLGHDEPQYETDEWWIMDRQDFLWIHCKDVETLRWFADHRFDYGERPNYFFHEEDQCSLTSKEWIWAHPKIEYNPGVILVHPGRSKWTHEQIMMAEGICDDRILFWSNSRL